MRFLTVAVIALISTLALADVSSGSLRGSEDERDLVASAGALSKSTDISIYKCLSGADVLCYDWDAFCLAFADSYSYSEAAGTDARSSEELAVFACCEAATVALARAYAEVKAVGTVNVKRSNSGQNIDLDVDMSLKTATLAVSLAATEAIASASVSGTGYAYTDVNALCQNSWATHLVLCAGASSGTVQLVSAGAGASSSGFTGAVGGSSTFQKADVDVFGKAIGAVKTCLVSTAQSFAVAASTSTAVASAFLALFNANFASVCLSAVHNHCGSPLYGSEPYCQVDPQVACDGALAYASGCGEAFASSFAEAVAAAIAHVNINVILRAQVSGSTCDVTMVDGTAYGEAAIASFCATAP